MYGFACYICRDIILIKSVLQGFTNIRLSSKTQIMKHWPSVCKCALTAFIYHDINIECKC